MKIIGKYESRSNYIRGKINPNNIIDQFNARYYIPY